MFNKKKILGILLLSSVLGVGVYTQQRGTPKQIRVLIDSLGNLVTAAQAATPPYTSVTFANARLLVDSSGALVVTNTGGGGLSDAFTSVPVSGQTTITASGATALTVAAGSNITLTTNNTTKTLTITGAAGFDTSACTNGWVLYKSAGNPCESNFSYDSSSNSLLVNGAVQTSNLQSLDGTVGMVIDFGTTIRFVDDWFRVNVATGVTTFWGAIDSTVSIKSAEYQSADGSPGVTVAACTGFKNGLCISGM